MVFIQHYSQGYVMARTATDEESLVYEIPEVARLLGMSRNAAYEAARRGDIPTIRIGKLIRVPKHALNQILERACRSDG
jgi:excisionase family DNA binding protein